jgi:hypothetical protein
VPKNLDTAMVINPCRQSNPTVVQSEIINLNEKKDESIKVPPFTIQDKQIP